MVRIVRFIDGKMSAAPMPCDCKHISDPRKSSFHTETQRSQRFSTRYVGRGSHLGGDRPNAFNDLFFFVLFVSLCEQFPALG